MLSNGVLPSCSEAFGFLNNILLAEFKKPDAPFVDSLMLFGGRAGGLPRVAKLKDCAVSRTRFC